LAGITSLKSEVFVLKQTIEKDQSVINEKDKLIKILNDKVILVG